MKILYKENIMSKHIYLFLKDLLIRNLTKSIFLIVDTCSAGTLFSEMKEKFDNLILLGSSGWDEYSISKGGDIYLGQPLTDEFSNELISYLNRFNAHN